MRLVVAIAVGIALGSRYAAAEPLAAATPAPAATPGGPCAQGALASIVRGLGRALAINGSLCAPPAGAIVLEVGYRNQVTTANGTSVLSTYPAPVVRFGTGAGNEIIVARGSGSVSWCASSG